jgi:predicted acylesterase/phospholipase RssA
MKILTKLDGKTFKDLSITAVNRESGKVFIFDADKTPDLEIAIACQASSALPVFLQKVKIEKKLLGINEPGYLTFVDGGYLNNVPFNVVDEKQAKIPGVNVGVHGQNLQTLVFVFDESVKALNKDGQSPFHSVKTDNSHQLYQPTLFRKFMKNTVTSVLAGIHVRDTTNVATKEQHLEMVREKYTQRNIPLNTLGVGTMDFKKALKLFPELKAIGERQTREYLDNHENEMLYFDFDDVKSMLDFIPLEKLRTLCMDEEQNNFFAVSYNIDLLQVLASRSPADNNKSFKV